MNALNPVAVPLTDASLEQHFADVIGMQADQALRWRAVATDRRVWSWIKTVIIITQFCVIMSMIPNVQMIPIIMYNTEDGWKFLSSAMSDLPPSVEVASIEARLWAYLKDRESYNSVEANDNYTIISAMSDGKVREQYQQWALPAKNRSAPANMLGQNGWMKAIRISAAFVTHSPDYSYGVYRIVYCRVTYDGQAPVMRAIPQAEIIQYHITRRIPFIQRSTFNPEALVVTQYPGPEDLAPAHNANLGSPNPCAELH